MNNRRPFVVSALAPHWSTLWQQSHADEVSAPWATSDDPPLTDQTGHYLSWTSSIQNMQLTKGVEWAAHSLVVLEVLGGQRALTSATLAEIYDLSPSYLHKHLQKLASHGLLSSTSGPTGGFALSRPGDQITLADVVAALSGEAPVFRCTEIRCQGIFNQQAKQIAAGGLCGINAAMMRAELAWRSSLTTTTIADLAAGVPEHSKKAIERSTGVHTIENGPAS